MGLRDKAAESAAKRFGEPYVKVKDIADLRNLVSDIMVEELYGLILVLPDSIHFESCDEQLAMDIWKVVEKYDTGFFVAYDGHHGYLPSIFRKCKMDYVDHCGG